jgi:hypothetical protein
MRGVVLGHPLLTPRPRALYVCSQSQGIGEKEWHEFVLAEMPSPRREQTSDQPGTRDAPDVAGGLSAPRPGCRTCQPQPPEAGRLVMNLQSSPP